MNIAFCVNRLALIGLGVTVSSLIRNCSDSERLVIWFMCANLQEQDKANLIQLLETEQYKGRYILHDFDPVAHFGMLRPLHGDWTPYSRILLPDVMANESQVLYLDADLVVAADVLDLENFDMAGKALAAVSETNIQHAIESTFLVSKCNLTLQDAYFNSGVLVMNLPAWREGDLKAECLKLGTQYSNELITADQTILNALFSRNFARLPNRFNCAWYAHQRKPTTADRMILHFVGSPKPWDIAGSLMCNGYKDWAKYLDRQWAKTYYKFGLGEIKRAYNIRRSYFRVLKRKMSK